MSIQVELKNIVKDYGSFRAVDDVSLRIDKGEIVTLLGPSGCGKTTTLRMIAGLFTPSSGQIRIAGEDVTQVPPYKRDIAMVFQNYALFPHLTVYENVVFGLKTRKIKDKAVLRKKAQEVLSIVQLENAEERYPKQLSGGQQQRVSLARALIVNPRVMLFDEPLSNLDEKLREQTRVEIRHLLKKLDITGIYVTHDQEEALVISDRIAVMNKGRIEQITVPRELYSHPETQFAAEFVGQANLFDGLVEAVEDGYVEVSVSSNMRIKSEPNGIQWKRGDKATVLIRPENIKPAPSGASSAAPNVCEGIVSDKSFLGSVIRYTLRLASGETLEMDVHPDDDIHTREEDQITVTWRSDRIVLLRKDGGSL
ncbi:ABC transporter ATP-binding protein [Paenibacillus macerans]|uniref:ABC transporter ATP-binding protein n=1 Tax=Paenibacillus macerans TaxID=44252 RepID=UPI00204064D3|nr:ABC transporter ATP-binding protein [Paenibacillus macerans]MCM3701927.1 ABC transporter ATP-binding protein [Paenibacillus macerans]